MKAIFCTLALAGVLGASALTPKENDSLGAHLERHNFATCAGEKGTCNACKNCKYCKHCADRGGKCSVCK